MMHDKTFKPADDLVAAAATGLAEAGKQFRTVVAAINRDQAAARRAAGAAFEQSRKATSGTAWDASEKPGQPQGQLTRKQRERANKAAKKKAPSKVEQLVTPEARAKGAYVEQKVPGPSIVVNGKERLTRVDVVLNRGGTAVERWFMNDRAGLFHEPQQQAIRYCRALWHRAGGLTAMDPTAERLDCVEGLSQQEALNELHDLKNRLPRRYWDVFENVCRFDEEAGVAGSSLASNSRSAVDAAKTCVAFTASMIAMWRRL